MAEWVVLELSPKAEGEDPDFIRSSIRHMIRDAEVYIPVSVTKVGDDRVINYLVEGYAFIKRNHPDDKYFKLEGTRYVQTVISTVGRANGRAVRQVACAKDSDIDRFRSQIHAEENQGIGVGDLIVVTSGPYRQIKATVIEDIPEREEVSVHIKLRSKEDIVTLPRSFLHLVQRAVKSPYKETAEALRAWLTGVKPFLQADGRRMSAILEANVAYRRLDLLLGRRQPIEGFFRVLSSNLDAATLGRKLVTFDLIDRRIKAEASARVLSRPLDAGGLREQGDRLVRLVGWDTQWKTLLPYVTKLHAVQTQAYSGPSFDPIQAKYVKVAYIDDVFERLGTIARDLESIEQSIAMEPAQGFDTVIVDGHNLAVRCATVPGLDTLKDSKGRYTGAIVGVLRSLGSFRKKFPGAEIIVVWDGSSQRRKRMFSEYKANRHSNGIATTTNGANGATNGATNGHANGVAAAFDQIHWLRDVLPFLGIKQAWNSEEEADDIIATLARQREGKNVVIITTDRDMLQLVSSTVRMLVPGKDKFYDAATVEAEYGVRPEHMVDLRALDGDTSDNIPGVPGFGLKTAAKLLRLYGTVEGVFSSNFAGVTASQYKKLRDAEKQVRLNVQLMALHSALDMRTVDPNPDQNVASERLRDVEVKSEPILAAMFGSV
jgi:DNA polymerase-1